jgi:hypothetical protein
MRINLGAHGHVCNGSQLQPKRHHRQWQLRLVVDDGTANLTAVPVAAAPAALATRCVASVALARQERSYDH